MRVRFEIPEGSDSLKPGCYEAAIAAVEQRTGPAGQYLAVTWDVSGGMLQVQDMISLSRNAAWRYIPFLHALGYPVTEGGVDVETDDLVGRNAVIHIATDRTNPLQMRPVDYAKPGTLCWRCQKSQKAADAPVSGEPGPAEARPGKVVVPPRPGTPMPDLSDL